MEQIYPGLTSAVHEIPLRPEYIGSKSEEDGFPTALGDDARHRTAATSLREKKWQEMMDQITDKPDWHNKLQNEEIQAKWTEEVLEYGRQSAEGFSETMAQFMISELVLKSKEHSTSGWIVAYDPGVLKSDVAISNDLKLELQTAIEPLENVSETAKDWHPNSNNQVLDLVHPSLWPLMYGYTKILVPPRKCNDDPLTNLGAGILLQPITTEAVPWEYSKVFQWLPADMQYNDKKEPKFTSYINNLHPQRYAHLYKIIEKVVDAAIPLWGRTLNSWPIKQRIVFETIEYNEIPEIERRIGESDSDYEDRQYEEHLEIKGNYIIQPEPHGNPIHYDARDLKEEFYAGLQVIVKLANIELKPGESYAGGSWHVEGQANEHIVSTALYYYDCNNITESRLAFRQAADEDEFNYDSEWHKDFTYEQGEDTFLPALFGLSNFESTVQDVGSVVCREGRLLTFPNTLQHRVSPFELEDKTKPGHRKILALFLVDPHFKIISTKNVPPQQKDWWIERILQTKGIAFLDKLPPEIVNHILSYVNDPMPLDTAKEKRLELITERSRYVKEQDSHFNEGEYSLCEH